jgi:hypothetical protein
MVEGAEGEEGAGVEEGRRATPFNYSGKVVSSVKDWKARVATEIARVTSLPQGGVDWVVESGPTGAKYESETVQSLIHVGGTITIRLEEKKIVSILDMKRLTEKELKVLATQV